MYRSRARKILFRNKKNYLPHFMFLGQVKTFVNGYYDIMVKRQQIDIAEQKEIRETVTTLAELIDLRETALASAAADQGDADTGDVSPISSASSGSKASDLGFDELNLGPGILTGPKKVEFMLTVKRDLLELLSSPILEDPLRQHFAELICKQSNIAKDVYTKWTVCSV